MRAWIDTCLVWQLEFNLLFSKYIIHRRGSWLDDKFDFMNTSNLKPTCDYDRVKTHFNSVEYSECHWKLISLFFYATCFSHTKFHLSLFEIPSLYRYRLICKNFLFCKKSNKSHFSANYIFNKIKKWVLVLYVFDERKYELQNACWAKLKCVYSLFWKVYSFLESFSISLQINQII